MRTRTNEDDAQPLSIPRRLRAQPVAVPHGWVPPPARLSLTDKLLPLVMLVCGYTAPLAASRGHDATASLLPFAAFVCVLRAGWAAARYVHKSVRYRRAGTPR